VTHLSLLDYVGAVTGNLVVRDLDYRQEAALGCRVQTLFGDEFRLCFITWNLYSRLIRNYSILGRIYRFVIS